MLKNIFAVFVLMATLAICATTFSIADNTQDKADAEVGGAGREDPRPDYIGRDAEENQLDAIISELGMDAILRDPIEPVPIDLDRADDSAGQPGYERAVPRPEELERALPSPPPEDPRPNDDGEKDADVDGEEVESAPEDVDETLDMPEVEDLNTSAIRELYYDGLYDVQDELYRQAIPKLERVISVEPTLYGAWESLGWSYWNTGQKEKTRRLWQRFKVLDPEHPLPYVLLAALALEDENLDEAKRLYEQALEKKPDESFAARMYNVRFAYARLIYWDGQIGRAIGMMEDLLAQDPLRTDVSLALARAYLQREDYSKALPLWTNLREIAEDIPESIASEALCLLHTGQPELAVEQARRAIELDPGNGRAIEVLIAAALFSDSPQEALPYLKQLYRETENEAALNRIRQQMIQIYVYLYRLDPREYGLDQAIELSREKLDENEDSIDSILLLAELLLMEDKLEESRRHFERVVEDLNAYNLRARRGLFEVFLSKRRYKDARIQYEYIRRFDPHNMYLYYYLARLESTRGDFYKAHDMLEKLEQAGRKGAVPILLYRPLTESEYFEGSIPVDRFAEHMEALGQQRFRIIDPTDLPDYFSAWELQPWWDDKTVIVTFDQVGRKSMRIADRQARLNGSVFTAHIPVEDVEDSTSNSCDWEELKKYQSSGYWSFGSALLDYDTADVIDYDGTMGNSLANRLWFREQGELESIEDYTTRVAAEFEQSREIIQSQLGDSAGRFVAYPRGDIGQEGESNLENPFSSIMQAAYENYEFGFIQSQFGFAFNGGNPLLYQRYSVSRWDTGKDIVKHVYNNHPVFLALLTRAKYAAFQGKQYLALDLLDRLAEMGYPEELHAEVDKFVRERLSRRLAAPMDAGSVSAGPLHLRLRNPFAGVSFNYFEDNQDRENWSAYLEGGLHLTPGLEVQGKVGTGELKQKVLSFDHPEFGKELVFDEADIGAKAIYTFRNGLYVSGEAIDRQYSSPRKDNSVLAYMFETQFRPVLAADIMLRYGHDMEPSALSVWEDITREEMMGIGTFRIRDWWDASLVGVRYDYSDDNVRDHLQLGTRFFVWERTGLNLGFKYAYADADEDRIAYWTPHKLHRYFIEPGFHGTYLRAYYDFRLRLGLGRESVRPEATAAYEEALRRADEGGYEPFRDEPPSEDWETIFGVSASWDIPFTKYWFFNGRVGYNQGPSYDEFRAHIGLKLKL